MNILAFAASLHSSSINKRLVSYAASLVDFATVEVIDLNDYEAPLYSQDREGASGVPAAARAFYDKVQAADAIMISLAEHNGSYTAGYKSLFDWCSRIDQKVYKQKPMLLLSTSPGPGGGKNVMAAALASMPHFGADVKGSLSIPRFGANFDLEQGRLHTVEFDTELRELVRTLAR